MVVNENRMVLPLGRTKRKKKKRRNTKRRKRGGGDAVHKDNGNRALPVTVVASWLERDRNKNNLGSRITLFALKDRIRLPLGCSLFLQVRSTTQWREGSGGTRAGEAGGQRREEGGGGERAAAGGRGITDDDPHAARCRIVGGRKHTFLLS